MSEKIGANKVGIRLAPFITQRGTNDEEAIPAILKAAEMMNRIGIAYVHLSEADWDDAPTVSTDFRHSLRQGFDGAIVVAGNYTAKSGEQIIADGLVDFFAYGREFPANPDLPYRFEKNLPLNEIDDMATLFGGDERGYTDYPAYNQSKLNIGD